MINTIVKNLCRASNLLNSISHEQYINTSVAPYNSSIAGHVRHVLDVFSCVFEGRESSCVDLTKRERSLEVEQNIGKGLEYIDFVVEKLKNISSEELKEMITVIDNLGDGKEKAIYSLGAILIQAHSHAIHHFASIGYVIHQLGIELPDDDFGFNPTTPKKVLSI
jgi:uncharacterized damage-inducible protein DinB